jgi:hypothetical protein
MAICTKYKVEVDETDCCVANKVKYGNNVRDVRDVKYRI